MNKATRRSAKDDTHMGVGVCVFFGRYGVNSRKTYPLHGYYNNNMMMKN